MPRAAIRRCSTSPPRLLGPLQTTEVRAERAGHLVEMDTTAVGLAAVVLGAGRTRSEDAIDAGVGFTVLRHPGDRVERGEPLFLVHHRPGQDVAEVHRRLAAAVRLGRRGGARAPAAPRPDGGRRRMSALFDRLQDSAAAVRARLPGVDARGGAGAGQRAGRSGAAARGRREPSRSPTFRTWRRRASPGIPAASSFGRVGSVRVGVLQGRLHTYEGWTAAETAYPVRLLVTLGARVVVLTNASGGVREGLRGGDWMAITDHLNLSGRNPLEGPNDPRLGPRFPDLSHAYDPGLRALLAAGGGRASAFRSSRASTR